MNVGNEESQRKTEGGPQSAAPAETEECRQQGVAQGKQEDWQRRPANERRRNVDNEEPQRNTEECRQGAAPAEKGATLTTTSPKLKAEKGRQAAAVVQMEEGWQ